MNNSEMKRKLDAIRSGDNAAFEELYNDLKTPIYTIIFRITWDKSTSEDVMQEVFLKLYKSPPEPQIKTSVLIFFRWRAIWQ